ncbi:hypothetical protein BDP27DRAFT_674400 [Rhodocollybia butyracea]|uniref:Nephrocystin 3-like N-terminal domain-containing protein n=1 Tax=Rhodocollybia butyracea TaxID=206335 RepID=A0A9P5U8E7_9AGAR|nr:hypothetical protein BDP27DRAFT_674400 [Rhodocollybia butyracea]
MFSRAPNFTISGKFQSVGRDLNYISFTEKERGLQTLLQYTSTSATYNAEARFPPPLCHPGTREAILCDLEGWAVSNAPDVHAIQWLYGPAGAGKSAIAQTFAEACAKKGNLAGSFFFWRSDSSRDNPQRLFTTLAFQMALAIPGLRPIINAAVINNSLVPTSFIENQFDTLILQPMLKTQLHHCELESHPMHRKDQGTPQAHLSSIQIPQTSTPSLKRPHTPPGSDPLAIFPRKRQKTSKNGGFDPTSLLSGDRPWILIIDGLDECSDNGNHERILSTLANAIQKYNLPLRILVASRPEQHIKESFHSTKFENICHWMPLDTYKASLEIRKYLQDHFREILKRHSALLEHVPRPWPPSHQIEHLVGKASGHFIYPSTVLKYIDNDGAVPADRLDIVLGLSTEDYGHDSPFAELDALYCQILSSARNRTRLNQILGAIIAFRERPPSWSYHTVELMDLLQTNMSLAEIRATCSGLHSIFQGPSPMESDLRFCHASLTDFLLDRRRSLHFYVEKSSGHDYLAQCCFKIISGNSSLCNVPHELRYWTYHCVNASGSDKLLSEIDLDVYSFITHCVGHGGTPRWYEIPCKLATPLLEVVHIWRRFQVRRTCSFPEQPNHQGLTGISLAP